MSLASYNTCLVEESWGADEGNLRFEHCALLNLTPGDVGGLTNDQEADLQEHARDVYNDLGLGAEAEDSPPKIQMIGNIPYIQVPDPTSDTGFTLVRVPGTPDPTAPTTEPEGPDPEDDPAQARSLAQAMITSHPLLGELGVESVTTLVLRSGMPGADDLPTLIAQATAHLDGGPVNINAVPAGANTIPYELPFGTFNLSTDMDLDDLLRYFESGAAEELKPDLELVGGLVYQIITDPETQMARMVVVPGQRAAGPGVDNAPALARFVWGTRPDYFKERFGTEAALATVIRSYLSEEGRVSDLTGWLLEGAPDRGRPAILREAERIISGFPELTDPNGHGYTRDDVINWVADARGPNGGGDEAIQNAIWVATGRRLDIYGPLPVEQPTVTLDGEDFPVTPEAAFAHAQEQADLVEIPIDGVTYKIPTLDAIAWLKSDRNFNQMSAYEKGSLANSMARHNTMSAADIGNLAARNAELAESVRSSMVTEGQRAWEFGQEFPETVRQFDVTQAGLESRFARQLLEDQRQANIRAGTEQFGQLTGLIPQFGQLALQQTQQQAELLRNPADVGWGMATARGETPWWPQTTQADLLNQSAQQFADIQAFLADQAAGIYPPGAAAPVSTPLPQMPPPWSPPPIDEPPIDDEIPDPERMFDDPPPPPRVITPGGPGSGWIQPDGAGADLEIPDPERMFDDPFDPSQYGTPEAAAWARNRFDADTLRRLRDQGLSGFDAELPELQYGGQTRGTRALITGDSSFGRPNPELVLNPTGAPLKVIPMNQMSPRAARLAQFGRLPRAEHGFPHTESTDWWDDLGDYWKNVLANQNPYPGAGSTSTQAAPPPAGATPGTTQGYNALTGFNYTIPDFPVPPMFTQAGIVERKRAFLPPGPRDVLAGQRPAPLEFGFRMPTPGLMGSLTPNERAAFGSQLASEYNTSLGEVESGIRQRFGQTRRAPRARRARY